MTDNARSNTTWTLVLAGLAAFMTALDTLVVTTALPVLRVDLHASLSDLEWTVNGYNLAFATFLLTGAALGDRFGRRRMFCVGLGVFTAASAASALAPSVEALIAARVFQGAGCRDRDPTDPDPDHRGVPEREARRRDRPVGRDHRARRRDRAGRRRRRHQWHRLALDLLAQRADRPRPDPGRRQAPDRELRPRPPRSTCAAWRSPVAASWA